jgi:hypothetical protein
MDGFVGSWVYFAIMGLLLVILALALPALIFRVVTSKSRPRRRRLDPDDDGAISEEWSVIGQVTRHPDGLVAIAN